MNYKQVNISNTTVALIIFAAITMAGALYFYGKSKGL